MHDEFFPCVPGVQADQGQPGASSGPQKNSDMANPSCPISISSPVISFLERLLVTGSLERGQLTPVLFPPPQSFAFCPLHKLVSIRTPLDSKQTESAVGKNAKERLASTLRFWQLDGSPNCLSLGGRLGLLVSCF